MKTVLLLILISVSLGAFTQTYYIDPSQTTNGTGTIENPFNTWYGVPWKDSAIYLQKRGTIAVETHAIYPRAHNITMDAYGTGENPVIRSTVGKSTKIVDINRNGFTIRNYTLIGINDPTAGIQLGFNTDSINKYVIENCIIKDCHWGIRVIGSKIPVKVNNCEIHSIIDDGIYTSGVANLEVFNCYIHDINEGHLLDSSSSAGGDCIQVAGDQGFVWIHNNILDHSNTGGKFCLIVGDYELKGLIDSCLIENNRMVGFKGNPGTSTIYVHMSPVKLTIRNNTFLNGNSGIYTGRPTYVYNNNFLGNYYGIYITAGGKVISRNNYFSGNSTHCMIGSGSKLESYCNKFNINDSVKCVYHPLGGVKSDSNRYVCEKAGMFYNMNTLKDWFTKTGNDLNSIVGPLDVDCVVYDTLKILKIIRDTIKVYKDVLVYDTINVYDTILVYDTVIIYDTIYMSNRSYTIDMKLILDKDGNLKVIDYIIGDALKEEEE